MTAALENYYSHHARIYDATRWSFLFGRNFLLQSLSSFLRPSRILEIGCGTGKNMAALSRLFPDAVIVGVDLSGEMLRRAKKRLGKKNSRIRLFQKAYDLPLDPANPFDLVVFSYTLSMINPGWSHAIRCAAADLAPKGTIAALDFYNSPSRIFKTWMQVNHVRMDSHLLPELHLNFQPEYSEIRRAYAGIWKYFLYIGRKI